MVGLNISLRYIYKPSYSPHCININVVHHMLGKIELMNKVGLIIFIGLLSCKPKTDNDTIVQADTDSLRTIESVQTSKQKEKEYDYRPIKPLDYGRVEIELTDTSQFYLLKGECAVTIMPDTTWLREYRESMPEESWIEIISDNQHYESLATDTLELKGIQVFYPRLRITSSF